MQPSRMIPPATLVEKVQRVYDVLNINISGEIIDVDDFFRMLNRRRKATLLIGRIRIRDSVHNARRELQRRELTQ